jgi:hypothetical protein
MDWPRGGLAVRTGTSAQLQQRVPTPENTSKRHPAPLVASSKADVGRVLELGNISGTIAVFYEPSPVRQAAGRSK